MQGFPSELLTLSKSKAIHDRKVFTEFFSFFITPILTFSPWFCAVFMLVGFFFFLSVSLGCDGISP